MYCQTGYPNYSVGYPMMPLNPRQYIMMVNPLVDYGLNEARFTGIAHAMTQVALIAYLMGTGYDMQTAHRIVESWEINETFPRY